MKAYSKGITAVLKETNSNINGLTEDSVNLNRIKFGVNSLTKKRSKNFFVKIGEAMLDPMLIILEIAFIITLGVNIGKAVKGMETDYYECIGIFFSIALSVSLTVIMEGKSQKAFEMLNGVYDFAPVKVMRHGEINIIKQNELVVGDIVYLESGDKIFADGRIIKCNEFKVDESTLSGESSPVIKRDDIVLDAKTPLAERVNSVYSGTFVFSGSATVVVTAVGDNSETGKIAGDLQMQNCVSAPLQEKLNRLSRLVTALGSLASLFVLILTMIRLFLNNNVSFDTVEDAFLSSIILIVASVPEGLPTTVAIALTLNVLKLSKSNALIKKLVATETVGCVSVICSDKTGTLTENKMTAVKFVKGVNLKEEKTLTDKEIVNNISINSTADIVYENREFKYVGSATECALLCAVNTVTGRDYQSIRKSVNNVLKLPFSSSNKYMITEAGGVEYIKGAPEKVLEKCDNSYSENKLINLKILKEQEKGRRVIAFAHKKANDTKYFYDGFAVISDSIRKDVYKSVEECKTAGIKVKILTGDNGDTAYAVASELKIATNKSQVVSASEIDEMSDLELRKRLTEITVVARSTPKTKLRIVNALKEMGEVVAVTGDGVNDAPAIKNADIGIAMGGGSEITKEASDIILLDNSFSTIVTAIFFGRNIYLNFQRFIMFQLSVNVTAVLFIVTSLVIGLANPFNTLELLWINVIMDGPPALTLGLETRSKSVMNNKPVKRKDNIVTKKMFLRIIVHAAVMCIVLCLQYKIDFIGCGENKMSTVIFTLFILFNLFNAFNCRETGSESILKNFKNNKLMIYTFIGAFVVQVVITEYLGVFFKTTGLGIVIWLKLILTALGIVVISEIYKAVYRKASIKKTENVYTKTKQTKLFKNL